MPDEIEEVQAEVMPAETASTTALERRAPAEPPVDFDTISGMTAERAVEVLENRAKILPMIRSAALKLTSPEDWMRFKDKEGRTVCYLQDCGCDRVRDLFGIEIFNVTTPQRIPEKGEPFMYLIMGDGRSRLTKQELESVEGGRGSDDDFITAQGEKRPTGIKLELLVRKSARANLDGTITRELAGMKSVPFEEIVEAWKGTGKDPNRCRIGRGFSAEERARSGASPQPTLRQQQAPERPPAAAQQAAAQAPAAAPAETGGSDSLPVPHCPKHGCEMKYVEAGPQKNNPSKTREAFYHCPRKDGNTYCPNRYWLHEWAQLVKESGHEEATPTPGE